MLNNDCEIEQTLLGAMLVKPEIYHRALVSIDDFFYQNHKKIYQCIGELAVDGIEPDYVTVYQKVLEHGWTADITPDFLVGLSEQVGFALSKNWKFYVTKIKEKTASRRILLMVDDMLKSANNGLSDGVGKLQGWRDELTEIMGSFGHREGKWTTKIREWVSVTPGDFDVTRLYADMGSVTVSDKAAVRKALERIAGEGLVVNIVGKKGWYRSVSMDMTKIKLKDANTQGVEIDLKYPFQLESWYKTFPKTICIVAGWPDSGKTAFLLNFVYKNLGRVSLPMNYFTSEMGIDEFYDRASSLSGFNAEYWDQHLAIWERSDSFEDVINPDGINIIDFLDLTDDFYKVAGVINNIWKNLRKGIAVIALQKDRDKPWGKGGMGSAERARLYLELIPGNVTKNEPNVMRVLKIKNWRNRLVNIKGKEFKFKLINGCSIRSAEDATDTY